MITGLDHFVIVAPEIDSAVSAYRTLLGRDADWRGRSDGAATAAFPLGDTSAEIMAPEGAGSVADRLRGILEAEGPGLKSIAFASNDLDGDHAAFARRGLAPRDIADGPRARSFRLGDEKTAGVRTFVVEAGDAPDRTATAPGAVRSLDHIVVTTPNPDRAAAHYGARIGLDLRLDRIIEQFSTRFLFFKTGGVIFEVVSSTKDSLDPSGPDGLMGLTYETADLEAAHARLSDAGLNVSDIRTGRKPGSRVFTVRDGTLGAPTLFIAHEQA